MAEKVTITVINSQGKAEEIEVEKGTKILIEVSIVDSDHGNKNVYYPIVEIKNAVGVNSSNTRPRVCLSTLPQKQENIVMP